MTIEGILYPVASLGGLGLVFGAGLAYASQKFKVDVDPKVTTIRDLLPGANCGGCGVPGCDSFAKLVSSGEAAVDGCPVGGPELAQKLAEVMGVEVTGSTRQVAKVICNGGSDACKEKFIYNGITDCVAANLVSGGSKSCKFGCLGLGTCKNVCPFGAIEMTEDHLAKIIPEKCTGCLKCVEVCPKNVIVMTPFHQEVVITCNSNDSGKLVRQKCSVGCIGCQICVKACPEGAIDFENNLAFINYEKCTNCYICVGKCPTKAIEGKVKKATEETAVS
ncbi:RnfABCDGE type electron transport complex subunit B [Anoxynatronum buryatiense]|uniref:Ion-translocating oxidoreductase complex subunit B n=1 Tax=Anoxynatronum buryatiense TaxID=489973 RepID=A0AA45WUX4_9CLOT|nr:RnfABCDGE type electron transport complex subunit B [Anoxynatronum buryatiense]SMP49760.1 electron transport complex, RnfABCDGE type, B subunit [Anoxynatronum buryatiense]